MSRTKAITVNVASWVFRSLWSQRVVSRLIAFVWPGFRHV